MRYLLFSILFACSCSLFATELGMRLRYERTDKVHGKVVGAGTAFGVNLGEFGIPGKIWVMTAAHNIHTGNVLHKNIQIEVDKKWVNCSVLAYDEHSDIAILQSSKNLKKTIKLAKRDALPGSSVKMSASIGGGKTKTYKGKLVQHFYMGTSKALVKIGFGHGASGAPVINESGKLVGIALAGIIDKKGKMRTSKGLMFGVSGIRTVIRAYLYKPVKTTSSKIIKSKTLITK